MKLRPVIIMAVILIISILGVSAGQAAPDKLGGGMHVVQWGENLASIAARYGTTAQAIAQANGITNQNYIYIGQQLIIPSLNNFEGLPANSQAPFANASGGAHTVKFGDTLTSIAMRYGTTVEQLMQANGLNNSLIYIGQQLSVPAGMNNMSGMDGFNMGPGPGPVPTQAGPGPVSMYSVKAGDTLSSISFRFGTSVNDVMRINNLYSTMIVPGQQLAIPGRVAVGFERPAGTYYTIQHGDTLAGIALRYGTTLQSILQANNLSQSQFIFPGQELVIPGMMHNPMPQQAMEPGMFPQMPQTSMMPGTMGNPAIPMSPPAGNSSMIAPVVPQQSGPVMPPQSMPSGRPLVPSMAPPNVSGSFPTSPVIPKTSPGVVFDNEPFIAPDQSAAPDLTMMWQGRVISQNQPEDWKYPAVLRVNVGGAKGMQVSVSKKGNNSWSTTGFTGTKPEYGDGAVEFAPLNPGRHVVSLDGQGKGASMTVDIKPNSLTYVEFVRVRADTGPVS